MRVFFDTNVLVYMFDADNELKKDLASARFEAEASAGRVLLSTQVLQEFYVAVTRKLLVPLAQETAESIVRDLSLLPTVAIDTERILAAIHRSRILRISFWDALIIEAALAGGADCLLSEDMQHGQVIDGLRIENPFPGNLRKHPT